MFDRKSTISLNQCQNRRLYKILSRNLRIGVFNEKSNGFLGIRTKFGGRFLFEEYHWDTGAPHGTVDPQKDLGIDLPETITLSDSASPATLCCSCGKGVEFRVTNKESHTGIWYHLEPSECQEIRPVHNPNKALYDWLEEQEKIHCIHNDDDGFE